MSEFLTTPKNIVGKIEDIISEAKEMAFLLTPYLSYIPDSVIERIEDALQRKVRVVLVYRLDSDIHPNEVEKLENLRGLEIFGNLQLHAKAYFNEKHAVVTSFNLSGSSEENNYEFGVFFSRKDEPEMFEKMVNQSRLIVNKSLELTAYQGDLIPVNEAILEEMVFDPDRILSPIEKQRELARLFSSEFNNCPVTLDGENRFAIEGRGLLIYTNEDRADLIFINPKQYKSRYNEIKQFIFTKHPELKAWFNSNRINIRVSRHGETLKVFKTVIAAINQFDLS